MWLSLWNPSTGVRRGMVVAFWYVGGCEGGSGGARGRGEGMAGMRGWMVEQRAT